MANLIKDEEDLDLHPKKTINLNYPKRKHTENVCNAKLKIFKTKSTKDGKKNWTIPQKALNKLATKTPLEPTIKKNILPEEDFDTEFSDEELLPESDKMDDHVSFDDFWAGDADVQDVGSSRLSHTCALVAKVTRQASSLQPSLTRVDYEAYVRNPLVVVEQVLMYYSDLRKKWGADAEVCEGGTREERDRLQMEKGELQKELANAEATIELLRKDRTEAIAAKQVTEKKLEGLEVTSSTLHRQLAELLLDFKA